MTEKTNNIIFGSVDYGRKKPGADREGNKPHVLFIPGIFGPDYVDEEELLMIVKRTSKKTGKIAIFIEQSVHYKLADKLIEVCDLLLINQFETHRRMEALGLGNDDDRAAAKLIYEIGTERYESSGGKEPRIYVSAPAWLVATRVAFRTYADSTKFGTSVKNRNYLEPNPEMIELVEQMKALASKRLVSKLKESKVYTLFDDILGIGPVAIGFWLSTRPWRFPTVGAWLKFAGFRADVETAYNHEMGGIMHNVMEGMIKANDPTYYTVYKEIKAQFIAKHDTLGEHKCGLKTTGTCHRADGKARNRVKTLLLKEVWNRLNMQSAWYRQQFGEPSST